MLWALLAIGTGFLHAFEADHVLAVSNIVSVRDSIKSSIRDGVLWGLGHSSTILIIGVVMMVLKFGLGENVFSYFEAVVGLMLIVLAVLRLKKHFNLSHAIYQEAPHYLAYFVGLMHGLAGSGSLVLLLMTQVSSSVEGMFYLLLFGVGSTFGMLAGAFLMSIPFSRAILDSSPLRNSLVVLSSLVCLVFGGMLLGENLI